MKEIEEATRKSIEERRRILDGQVKHLQMTNLANIQQLTEALMPITGSIQNLIMDLRQEAINLQEQQVRINKGQQVLEQLQSYIEKRTLSLKKANSLLTIKQTGIALLIGAISAVSIFYLMLYLR